ncbi:MAG TPA: sulfur carrier protein ThiS [Halanaerobiales bacterium]|nr:sulfur carrier protein ThiS [Halanaerobiales bacterium]
MRVFVNQDKKTYPEGTTIAEIVKKTNYNDKSYNVVRNGKLVKKDDYQKTTISKNDKIRILPFAMGG